MMQNWFEAKIRYTKVTESGLEKVVTEQFLLDAVSFTEAESRMIQQAQQMVKDGMFAVKDIKQSNVVEVFPSLIGGDWYKVKILVLTIDEEAGREKRITIYHLVEAKSIEEAIVQIIENLGYMVVPYEIVTVTKTAICDVFPYDLGEKAEEMQKQI